MNKATNGNLRGSIVDDLEGGIFLVHRSSMTSPEIFALEQERIFRKNWLYLGHESEIEKPGDYRRRIIAGQSIIFVRGSDGVPRALFNTCTHRGAMVCRQDEGNATSFPCFYHAWTYNNRGALIGVPNDAAYGPAFDRKNYALKPVPRFEIYRGFAFVSFDPSIEALETHLAGAREYLDLVADQAETGMYVVAGTQKYGIRANWKLLVENSIDGYHAPPLHATYFAYLEAIGTDFSGDFGQSRGRALGNGHSVIDYRGPWARPVARWERSWGEEAKKEIGEVRKRLDQRLGPERAERVAETSRNLLVYPNLIINDIMAVTIRTFEPISADEMKVTAWALAPKDEPAILREKRLDNFLTFLGPGGFATPDDVEALESCQSGFRATGVEWSDISRGMKRDAIMSDELQMRSFWRRWYSQMNGLAKDPWPVAPTERDPETPVTEWHAG